MSFLTGRRRDGQVLVQVAMLMLVFFVFLAIAIDVGHILTERRRMQNAADAGALAGAWEICFGDPARAVPTAQEYTIDRNHAQVADVSIAGGRVTVYAREATDLYVARLFGIPTADINARAVAACGGVTSLCGLWPISFHIDRWNRLECWNEGDDEDVGTFYVFNDGRFEEDDMCYDDIDGECHPPCDILDSNGDVDVEGACECSLIPPDNDAFVVGSGHRGWLLFPRPRPPYDYFDMGCADNCGDQVRCWIDAGSYSGEIPLPMVSVGMTNTICLPGQPGVDESVRIDIERDHIGQRPNVLLWDRQCDAGEPVTGQCPGDPYHIVGAGCIEIVAVLEVDLERREAYRPPDYCLMNVKVVQARRLCLCDSECGSTSGELPAPGEVRSVSLVE
jgi:hypothetical protein